MKLTAGLAGVALTFAMLTIFAVPAAGSTMPQHYSGDKELLDEGGVGGSTAAYDNYLEHLARRIRDATTKRAAYAADNYLEHLARRIRESSSDDGGNAGGGVGGSTAAYDNYLEHLARLVSVGARGSDGRRVARDDDENGDGGGDRPNPDQWNPLPPRDDDENGGDVNAGDGTVPDGGPNAESGDAADGDRDGDGADGDGADGDGADGDGADGDGENGDGGGDEPPPGFEGGFPITDPDDPSQTIWCRYVAEPCEPGQWPDISDLQVAVSTPQNPPIGGQLAVSNLGVSHQREASLTCSGPCSNPIQFLSAATDVSYLPPDGYDRADDGSAAWAVDQETFDGDGIGQADLRFNAPTPAEQPFVIAVSGTADVSVSRELRSRQVLECDNGARQANLPCQFVGWDDRTVQAPYAPTYTPSDRFPVVGSSIQPG